MLITIPKKEHKNNLGQSFLSIFSDFIKQLNSQNSKEAPKTLKRMNPNGLI
jgi:dimeric dUTPase (all-alpha-NTP-PPase superfamily)